MNDSIGIFIGGFIPALAFGVGALLQKQSNDIGIGQNYYLLYFAVGIVLTSVASYFLFPRHHLSHLAGLFAMGHGVLFGAGFICLAMGLTIYQEPVSKLVPLANMSTLVTVFLGLTIFGEYAKLNAFNLLLGASLVVCGGVLVSRA
ncbi:hypothetical protein [Acaryochloris sp. IP29b_bin.148]|uniref:hypothetical protein n=1 Tax=Acaryochloris sp. IP29b_bin.148 TaxID=2969218 RepID=UPI00260604B3|nr:hypothetical protein [Acaryochloris sp. IP29b_bin.148]